MRLNYDDEYELALEQRKHNTTPLSNSSGVAELLPKRKKHRTSQKKRKLSKDELQYQRFVQDLHKDIKYYMGRRLRESRFNTSTDTLVDSTMPNHTKQNALKSKRSVSTIATHRTNDTDATITSITNPNGILTLIKQNETKRLAADVQTILTGSAVKNFYVQFIRPSRQRCQSKNH